MLRSRSAAARRCRDRPRSRHSPTVRSARARYSRITCRLRPAESGSSLGHFPRRRAACYAHGTVKISSRKAHHVAGPQRSLPACPDAAIAWCRDAAFLRPPSAPGRPPQPGGRVGAACRARLSAGAARRAARAGRVAARAGGSPCRCASRWRHAACETMLIQRRARALDRPQPQRGRARPTRRRRRARRCRRCRQPSCAAAWAWCRAARRRGRHLARGGSPATTIAPAASCEDHRPYHAALAEALTAARARFGAAVLLDLHSMPPLGRACAARIVLGDRFGAQRGSRFSARDRRRGARATGLPLALNAPYPGGHFCAAPRPTRDGHPRDPDRDRPQPVSRCAAGRAGQGPASRSWRLAACG